MVASVVCIQGPTASGKSGLADAMARRLDGEVVSADSMQIYTGMDIGTAKVMPCDRSVVYHCIDILDPGQPYSAALFQRDGRAAIEDIQRRGKTAVLCGGTGLYVRAVLDEMDFAAGEQEGNEVRSVYENLVADKGPQAAYDLLVARDPDSAALIHPNNTRRVVRALEMLDRGESYARRKARFKAVPAHYRSVKIALSVERTLLYERIDARVDEMVEQGLVDEVRGLLDRGFREGLTAQAAIGYKEIVAALEGECTLEEAIDQVKQSTRRYAKRQLTWLRGDTSIHWLDANEGVDENLIARAVELIENDSQCNPQEEQS